MNMTRLEGGAISWKVASDQKEQSLLYISKTVMPKSTNAQSPLYEHNVYIMTLTLTQCVCNDTYTDRMCML